MSQFKRTDSISRFQLKLIQSRIIRRLLSWCVVSLLLLSPQAQSGFDALDDYEEIQRSESSDSIFSSLSVSSLSSLDSVDLFAPPNTPVNAYSEGTQEGSSVYAFLTSLIDDYFDVSISARELEAASHALTTQDLGPPIDSDWTFIADDESQTITTPRAVPYLLETCHLVQLRPRIVPFAGLPLCWSILSSQHPLALEHLRMGPHFINAQLQSQSAEQVIDELDLD